MKRFDQSKTSISRKAAAGLASGLLLLQLSCVTLGGRALNPVLVWTALCVLSATALALIVMRLRRQDPGEYEVRPYGNHRHGTGAMGEAARDAEEIVSGDAVLLQGLMQQGGRAQCAAATDAAQRRRVSGTSCRLWTRVDGFTLSGTR